MKPKLCREPIPSGALVDYWTDALEESASAKLEEHLFTCGSCTDRMARVASMARGVGRLGRGGVRIMLTKSLVERLRTDAVRVRSYTIDTGGSVSCTVAPEDELCVTTLRADLREVGRLDLEVLGEGGQVLSLAEDVPFDRERGEVLVGDSCAFLRTLPALGYVLRLTAMDAAAPRLVGEYRMLHRPWPG